MIIYTNFIISVNLKNKNIICGINKKNELR